MESAITSRETSEYFIPSVPMEMPSLTVMVPKICGMVCGFAQRFHGSLRQIVQSGVAGSDGAVAVGDAR